MLDCAEAASLVKPALSGNARCALGSALGGDLPRSAALCRHARAGGSGAGYANAASPNAAGWPEGSGTFPSGEGAARAGAAPAQRAPLPVPCAFLSQRLSRHSPLPEALTEMQLMHCVRWSAVSEALPLPRPLCL